MKFSMQFKFSLFCGVIVLLLNSLIRLLLNQETWFVESLLNGILFAGGLWFGFKLHEKLK